MASNLRVDTILPSTGTSLGIGTASGTTTVTHNLSVTNNFTATGSVNAASATITGNLGVGGVLTYEDVTNIDSVGVITARSGVKVSAATSSLLIGSAHASGQRNTVEIHASPNDGLAISRDGGGSDTDLVLLKNTNNSGTIEVRNSSNVQKIFLDSSGASHISGGILGIQNTSPGSQYFNTLVVGNNDSGDKGITIRSSSSNSGVLAFSDADSGSARYAGYISYSHSTNNMVFHTLNGDARMTITSQGYVTKPNNVLFHAEGGPNTVSNATIVFTNRTYNVGGGYNNSTGKFTPPIAGYYAFYFQVYRNDDQSDANASFYYTPSGGSSQQHSEARLKSAGAAGYAVLNSHMIMYMNLGDTMHVYAGAPTIHCNSTLSYFEGYLIG